MAFLLPSKRGPSGLASGLAGAPAFCSVKRVNPCKGCAWFLWARQRGGAPTSAAKTGTQTSAGAQRKKTGFEAGPGSLRTELLPPRGPAEASQAEGVRGVPCLLPSPLLSSLLSPDSKGGSPERLALFVAPYLGRAWNLPTALWGPALSLLRRGLKGSKPPLGFPRGGHARCHALSAASPGGLCRGSLTSEGPLSGLLWSAG